MFGGGSYCVTPQKGKLMDKSTSKLIRDVKRRSFRISRTPKISENRISHERKIETSLIKDEKQKFESKPGLQYFFLSMSIS